MAVFRCIVCIVILSFTLFEVKGISHNDNNIEELHAPLVEDPNTITPTPSIASTPKPQYCMRGNARVKCLRNNATCKFKIHLKGQDLESTIETNGCSKKDTGNNNFPCKRSVSGQVATYTCYCEGSACNSDGQEREVYATRALRDEQLKEWRCWQSTSSDEDNFHSSKTCLYRFTDVCSFRLLYTAGKLNRPIFETVGCRRSPVGDGTLPCQRITPSYEEFPSYECTCNMTNCNIDNGLEVNAAKAKIAKLHEIVTTMKTTETVSNFPSTTTSKTTTGTTTAALTQQITTLQTQTTASTTSEAKFTTPKIPLLSLSELTSSSIAIGLSTPHATQPTASEGMTSSTVKVPRGSTQAVTEAGPVFNGCSVGYERAVVVSDTNVSDTTTAISTTISANETETAASSTNETATAVAPDSSSDKRAIVIGALGLTAVSLTVAIVIVNWEEINMAVSGLMA